MLRELEALVAALGANPDIVQGAGGNASLKHEGALWVKASGTWMVDALREPTFVAVERSAIGRMLERDGAAFDPRQLALLHGREGTRPSIETPLHAVMPQTVVLHVHSVRALAFAVRRDATSQLAARLQGMRWAFVPYRRPGAPLTDAISRALASTVPAPDVLVLGNHGLVVAGDDVPSVRARLDEVEARLDDELRPTPPPREDELRRFLSGAASATWRLPRSPVVHALGTDAAANRAFSTGVLYPDHVVFLGDAWPEAQPAEPIEVANQRHQRQHGRDTSYWVVAGAGVVVRDDIADAPEQMLECAARVGQRLGMDTPLQPLDDDDLAALTHWEAEAYRAQRGRPASERGT